MSKRKLSEGKQENQEPRRVKRFKIVLDEDAEAPDVSGLTEIEEQKILLAYGNMLRGATSKVALKAAGLSLKEIQDVEEGAIQRMEKKSDTAMKVWKDIKENYQRTIYTQHPEWAIDELRSWLNEKIVAKEIPQLGEKDFDVVATHLSHFFSNERIKTLKTDLPKFVSTAPDAKHHKKALKEDRNYMKTEEGKKWLKRAAVFVTDPNSTVRLSLDPTEELNDFIREPLAEIILKGAKADLDRFKKKKKAATKKSLANKHGGLEHSEKPKSGSKAKGSNKNNKNISNKENKSKKSRGSLKKKFKNARRSHSNEGSEDEDISGAESKSESEENDIVSVQSEDESANLSESSSEELRLRNKRM